MSISTDQWQLIDLALERWKEQPGALLPLLHHVQDALGYIPPQAIGRIASAIKSTRAEIHGVISFYHDFRTTPGGRHKLQLCRAEACQSVGARALESHTRDRLGIDFGQTSSDGNVSLDAVYCLGNCACGPSVRIDDRVVGRVTPDRLDRLIDELESEPVEVR